MKATAENFRRTALKIRKTLPRLTAAQRPAYHRALELVERAYRSAR